MSSESISQIGTNFGSDGNISKSFLGNLDNSTDKILFTVVLETTFTSSIDFKLYRHDTITNNWDQVGIIEIPSSTKINDWLINYDSTDDILYIFFIDNENLYTHIIPDISLISVGPLITYNYNTLNNRNFLSLNSTSVGSRYFIIKNESSNNIYIIYTRNVGNNGFRFNIIANSYSYSSGNVPNFNNSKQYNGTIINMHFEKLTDTSLIIQYLDIDLTAPNLDYDVIISSFIESNNMTVMYTDSFGALNNLGNIVPSNNIDEAIPINTLGVQNFNNIVIKRNSLTRLSFSFPNNNFITSNTQTITSNENNISSVDPKYTIMDIITYKGKTAALFRSGTELALFEILDRNTQSPQFSTNPIITLQTNNSMDNTFFPSSSLASRIHNIIATEDRQGINKDEFIISNTSSGISNIYTYTGSLNCLLEGSQILTPSGFVDIESLNNNDEIISSSGKVIKIKQITKTVTSKTETLCMIPKNMFNNTEDVFLSEYHAFWNTLENKLTRPIDLKAEGKLDLSYDIQKDKITYYHIELFDKINDMINVSGLFVEGDKQYHGQDCCFDIRNKNKEFIDTYKK